MADNPKPIPTATTTPATRTRQTVKFLTAGAAGAVLLVLAGLTLTGTVVSLVVATPALVMFSPVLIPAGVVLFLGVLGLVLSGGFGVAAVSALAWIYSYVAGKHPRGSKQVDSARRALARKAQQVKEKAKDYRHYIQNKAHEVTSGGRS